jgi:hypothetical protein
MNPMLIVVNILIYHKLVSIVTDFLVFLLCFVKIFIDIISFILFIVCNEVISLFSIATLNDDFGSIRLI